MKFASRQDAGQQLGKFLRKCKIVADLVLGLPRGGVVVAAEVARELKLSLDVLVVRKISHPLQREFAVGALAEPDVVSLNEESLRKFPVARSDLEKVIEEEKIHLRDYRRQFHFSQRPKFDDKIILLVDDGLATGATAEVAAISARRQNAKKILIAAPVASPQTVERLRHVADEVLILFEDFDFQAVGQYYENFSQTGDEEVVALLSEAARQKVW
jgi:predicted phosphoribosyltransferase